MDNDVRVAVLRAVDVVEAVKCHKKYNSSYSGGFPSSKTLSAKPHAHLPIIVEQLQLITGLLQNGSEKPCLLGIWAEEEDLVNLLNQIVSEVSELEGEMRERIATNSISFGQTVIPGHTLFTLARSISLSSTYKKIDLLNQKGILESFSISFLLRLSIESKLSTMMGFKSVKSISSSDEEFLSDHFPVGPAFRFLKERGDSYFTLPVSVAELKKVYDWSCRFVHTGRKEYIWMALKAIACVERLYEGHAGKGYLGVRISNFREGKTVEQLQEDLNEYFHNYNSSHVASLIWELSDDIYDVTNNFWDARKK